MQLRRSENSTKNSLFFVTNSLPAGLSKVSRESNSTHSCLDMSLSKEGMNRGCALPIENKKCFCFHFRYLAWIA
jgi:hypothetical protein